VRPVGGRPPLRLIEGGGPRVSLAPAIEFAALGAGLTLVAALLGRLPSWFHNLGTFQSLYALAFAFFGLALARIRRYEHLPHAGLAVLAVAVAARLALLPAAPSLSGDIYRYVWEGRVLLHGGNPYQQSPDDPALAALRDRVIYPGINHKDLATIYPPLAEAGFALVALVSPTVAAFKAWNMLHDLALVLVLMAWALARGASPVLVIAYAWNPLVLVEYSTFWPPGRFWVMDSLRGVISPSRNPCPWGATTMSSIRGARFCSRHATSTDSMRGLPPESASFHWR